MTSRDRVAVTSLALLLAAVGVAMFAIDAAQTPDPTPIYVTPPPGLTYSEGIVGHPFSINPLTATTQADRDLVALLFRGLLKSGPNGTLVPDLAASWNSSADGLTYTFNIRGDARWEDGQPVTAADVVFTVTLAQDPDYSGPLGATWQGIKATAVSPSVVRFTLPTPLGGFARQATLRILPEHLLADVAVADLANSDYSGKPIGDGPYRIAEIDDSHALLTRVAASSSAAPSAAASASGTGTQGKIESLDMLFFDDQASAVKAFQDGRIEALGGLPPAAVKTASSRAGSQVVGYKAASMISVVLNQRAAHPEMANLNVRKALLAAIDRPGVVATVLGGTGSVADVPLPAWSSLYDPTAVVTTPFDSSAAAADLTAAGWTQAGSGWNIAAATTPYSLSLLSPNGATNPVAFEAASRVVQNWQAIGLKVSLKAMNAADYGQALAAGSFDAAVVDYQLGLDPDVSPLLLSSQVAPVGSNLSGVSDKTLDGLLAAVRTTSDPTARAGAVSALEKYISTNVLMLPICFVDYEFVVSGKVKGLVANEIADPSDRFWDVLDWRLAGDG
jgi:peptide/nickel transport system substrate-binding protein